VAARIAPVASATDTGGSIREPAAFTGITGTKPTYGRPSRWGMIAFASSLDTAGLMTQSAEDAALVFNEMLGFDPKDSTSVDRPAEDYTRCLGSGVKGLKIGVPKEFFGAGLQPDVEAAVRSALDEYRKLGAELVEVSLPNAELGIPVYYVVAPAECSSNLSRFDGVRYGHRAKDYGDLADMIKKSRAEGFGPEPKRRILIGTYVLSHGYYDAYYIKAQQVRRLIADEFQRAFRQCDVIAGPVTTSVAFGFGEKAADPVAMYMADLYTVPGSLAGVPSMSIPCGFGAGPVNGGRPVGLQLIANYFDEARMLGAAHAYQQATGWHRLVPPGA
jgi:aspartyl-tRNA(Asn)/glutamyl-tRNA(Gln) amidotransferase subunit A